MRGKSVLIVGAGSYSKTDPSIKGIGTATAKLFEDTKRYEVSFTYNGSKEGAQRLAREIEGTTTRSYTRPARDTISTLDCRFFDFKPYPYYMQFNALNYEDDWDKIERFIDDFGLPDVVVYTAGVRFWKKELNEQELHENFVVNYECPRFLTDIIGNRMKSRNSGRIILVSSVLAGRKHPYLQAYCDAKDNLNRFAEEKTKEMQKHGVIVIPVCPVLTKTPLTEERLSTYEALTNEGKMPKIADPEEISEVILSASEENGFSGEVVYAPSEHREWLDFYDKTDWNCSSSK